ncbi:MAG: bifunctional glutamate N-acetyltransferase/amino-acid acetyltransferase ArgJ [Desulfomicrobium sp.]|nr:bifunctional glutamate N-acetyltransferase/amino-acid acetyltransferase ArgJ [Pseudomonadota bacterium]MBV1712923.1 bifunctional glutamate N-acetyltransferase/amino-acid acetyltransferase ArgJ [Desulfomicrobium sp.]MBU4571893.1 bifunctional glutamate N-acetyltransferase/amino-acid acetyltransferase ArgJ [Pseudomonadota bacterium]MBU4596042.1 bifunctional glutamate N-acetyltransferase/amino-acid acetyltransferase ArgJ [Pseudomonadota bacterium]MBV1721346.1 bifunctional glutamate N-acetyltrans
MTTPSGFQFSTAQCGFKRPGRSDLGLVISSVPAVAAGVFTTNRFQAAPVLVARDVLDKGAAGIRAIVVNSGQANACTGQEGIANCRSTLEMLSVLGLEPSAILPASTGVIGDQLKMDLWEKGVLALRENLGRVGLVDMARAIMTTDTFPKLAAREVKLSTGTVRLAGFCKGAGMICPNMATMLGFILCDAGVEPQWWQEALTRCADKSFNAITVDGDTSTNDCVLALANGAAAEAKGADLALLEEALLDICQDLAFMIVQDAEGGTKVMRINVHGAASMADAQLAARAVGNSPLVKTALYGRDPNWGRIVAALGRSGAEFVPEDVIVRIAGMTIFRQGTPVKADWDSLLASALRRDIVDIDLDLCAGEAELTLLASDFTEEYIKINAEYRT